MPAELSLSFFVCPDILITITIFIPQLSERHSRRRLAAEFIADHLHLLCWTYLWLDPQLLFSGQDNEAGCRKFIAVYCSSRLTLFIEKHYDYLKMGAIV